VRELAAALVFALPLLAAPAFTIDQILSSPFPENLVAQPNGDAIAWVTDTAGVRNIWVARAPDFKPVRLTRFNADDGQELGGIEWKKDGSSLAFTRSGTNQEIWVASETGDPPVKWAKVTHRRLHLMGRRWPGLRMDRSG
jgi:hypothetical protein